MAGAAIGKEMHRCGVVVIVTSGNSSGAGSRRAEIRREVVEVDVTALAATIREQKALPLTDTEADILARSLEVAGDEEELLADTVAVLRLVVDRLEASPAHIDSDHEPGRF